MQQLVSLHLLLLLGILQVHAEVIKCICGNENNGCQKWTGEIKLEKNSCNQGNNWNNKINWSGQITLPPEGNSPNYPIAPKSPKFEAWRTRPLGHGYEKFPGLSSYKFHETSDTWENARRRCEQEGAHLAIINSESESTALKALFARYPAIKNVRFNDFAYIGYHDLYEEGNYLTIFGEPLNSVGFERVFGKNEDAGRGINNPGEDCGAFHRHTGALNDLRCDDREAFICEREPDYYPSPNRDIDYIAGAYDGVEMEVKPPIGKVRRTKPARGYEYFDDIGFYRFHSTSATWDNARRICKAEGGHLAIINSVSEHQVLLDLFRRHPALQNVLHNDYAFVGFHDQYQEGKHVTIYNEPLTATGYYEWVPGQPDNLGGDAIYAGEDCGSIHRNGKYNDLPCNMFHAFICEQELYV